MNRNVRVALIIATLLSVWLFSGLFFSDKSIQSEDADALLLTRVQVQRFSVQDYRPQLSLRARVEPNRAVDIKAQIAGRVTAVPRREGFAVKQGEIICEVDAEDRRLRVDQAQANLHQADIAYRGTLQLNKSGLQSELAISQAKTNLQMAKTALKRSQVDMENLSIRAPFAGIVESRPVEVGDFLTPGQLCARIVELDPLKIVAQVTERDINQVSLGRRASAVFASNMTMEATISYLSHEANSATRSYRIEALAENVNGSLRAGISGRLNVVLASVKAHFLPASLILLDDRGDTVVRALDKDNRVVAVNITGLGETEQGIWVSGLPSEITLITVGQNYVAEGELVEPHFLAVDR